MNEIRNQLKSLFTGYWEYLAVHTACKLNIFDLIQKGHDTVEKLRTKTKTDKKVITLLIQALLNKHYLIYIDESICLTDKSEYLTENHPLSLKNACILWGLDHLDAWQQLEKIVKTGKPVYDDYFEYLSKDKFKLENYHRAMFEYAIEDYKDITNVIDFSGCNKIMDVGGGLGALIKNIKSTYPHKKCYLLEKQEVIELVKLENIELIAGNFFQEIPDIADCLILSRVVHDWEDKKASVILNNCKKALPTKGKLVIIENFADELDDGASLLSINMMVMCKSFERTKNEYLNLLMEAGFKIIDTVKINRLQNAIIATK